MKEIRNMNNKLPTYIDVEEFVEMANEIYERARSGERIIIRIEGKPKYELYSNTDLIENELTDRSKAFVTPHNYQRLVDFLDPIK